MNRNALWTLLAVLPVVTSCATPPEIEPEITEQDLVFPPPPEAARFHFERTIRSSADIEIVDKSTGWRRILTGETVSAVGFSKPFDVDVCQGKIFVSDTVRRAVLVFDVPTGEFTEIGIKEPGALRKPLGLATDSSCNLYVADGTLRTINVYDANGTFLNAVGGQEWFDRLTHVEVDVDGGRMYCVDTGGVDSERHHVRVFDVATGEHLLDIGRRGDGQGELNLPRDIALGADDRLYVVDGGNFRIQVYELDGTHVQQVGSIGVRPGQFSRPKGIDTDADGNIYVSDSAFGNFQIFDANGDLLLFVGQRSESMLPARYLLPAGLSVDEDGRVYMVDQFFRKLDVFRPADIGTEQGFLGARIGVAQ